ncbi:MBL fold metallo-hydrolase, partial [Patescibacteria group bacterium]|nr:MBL fold metallo-hydrolase [Patescibacteria group bacterium]
MALRVEQIAVGGFDDNFSYLISADETNECLIVDPSGAFERVVERVDAQGLSVEGVLITHTHFDHIDRMPDALARFPV